VVGVSWGCWQRRRQTYRLAVVAVGGDLATAAAELNASVALGSAPAVPQVLGDRVGRDGAARDDGLGKGGVLGRGKASHGRGGDDERRVEHGGWWMEDGGWSREYQCLANGVSAWSTRMRGCACGAPGNTAVDTYCCGGVWLGWERRLLEKRAGDGFNT
jgi:hypothetical protein